ncbi:MAG: hypothetical protein U9R21_06485 [Candidatus Thermoplasmatota archaeon]|nr:hypothetical protein [Candidatus Thermoplasmatota archaeon]
MLEIFGSLPLWAIILVGLIVVVIAWKIIKFALKILLVLIVSFAIMMGLDILGVFDVLQNLLSGII